MTTLYLVLTTDYRGGELEEGEELPYGCREPEYIEHEFLGLSLSSDVREECTELTHDLETIEPGEVLYVGIARYYSGDSFGTTYGYYEVFGVSRNSEELEEECSVINSGTSNKHYSWVNDYFGGLEHAEVHTFVVTEKGKKNKNVR